MITNTTAQQTVLIATTSGSKALLVTIDGSLLFWSLVYSSIVVGVLYIFFAGSFVTYLHAVHRKKTVKPWLKKSRQNTISNGNATGSNLVTIEMINKQIKSSKSKLNADENTKYVKMDNKRLLVCREIIETEVSYLKVLTQIVDFYFAPLVEALDYGVILPKSQIDGKCFFFLISDDLLCFLSLNVILIFVYFIYLAVIFRHAHSLHKLHKTLLDKIEKKAGEQNRSFAYSDVTDDDETTESQDFVFDAFNEMIPFFRTYTAFCNNYDIAQEKILECVKIYPKFSKFLEKCRHEPGFTGLDLHDLLIQPVQRICRYPLLFSEALKHMPTNHVLYNKTMIVLEAIKGIAAEVDKARDVAKNSKILHALQQGVRDSKVELLINLNSLFCI